MEYINVQYKNGRDERIIGDDLEDRWEQLTGEPGGIQYAAYYVPKRKGDGYRAAGILGVPREEHAANQAASEQARKEDSDRKYAAMVAARDWTWTAPNADRHL